MVHALSHVHLDSAKAVPHGQCQDSGAVGRPRQPASMLADLTAAERSALQHSSKSLGRHAVPPEQGAEGRAGSCAGPHC